jgi:hypothetical protein
VYQLSTSLFAQLIGAGSDSNFCRRKNLFNLQFATNSGESVPVPLVSTKRNVPQTFLQSRKMKKHLSMLFILRTMLDDIRTEFERRNDTSIYIPTYHPTL